MDTEAAAEVAVDDVDGAAAAGTVVTLFAAGLLVAGASPAAAVVVADDAAADSVPVTSAVADEVGAGSPEPDPPSANARAGTIRLGKSSNAAISIQARNRALARSNPPDSHPIQVINATLSSI